MKYLFGSLFLAVALTLFSPLATAQVHFTACISRTADNATIVIPAEIEPVIGAAPLTSGDEIAVLAPDGSCVGVVVWTGASTAITAWGADDFSQGGYTAGKDLIQYAVWDASEQVEYTEVEASYANSSAFLRTDGIYANGAIFELSSFVVVGSGDGSFPVLKSPQRNATGVSLSPQFSWGAVPGATSYDLQVSTSTGFSPLVAAVSGISGTSKVVEGLSEGTSYYWRVRAVTADSAGAFTPARKFTTVATQTIALQQGWNIVSSYIAPSPAGMENVFGPAADQLVLAKDENGKVFWPESDINDIGSWDKTHAYKVYMEARASVEITGAVIEPGKTPVSLQQGWNMFAYLRTSEMPVGQAVAGIGEDLVLLKDNFGNVFMPELGIDDVGSLQPGQGYVAYVRKAASFTYPANTAPPAAKMAVQARMAASTSRGIGYSAHVVSRTSLLPEGEHLTAWSGSRQVGSGIVEDSTVVVMIVGDDPLTQNVVEGARPGERIVLKKGTDVSGSELELAAIRNVLTDADDAALVYRDDAVWEVSIAASSVGTDPGVELQFGLQQNYPNPFRSTTTIRYALESDTHVLLEVFNMLGQRLRVLVSEDQRAGQYQISFDGGELSSGTYFYRLQAGNRTETKSMVLLN